MTKKQISQNSPDKSWFERLVNWVKSYLDDSKSVSLPQSSDNTAPLSTQPPAVAPPNVPFRVLPPVIVEAKPIVLTAKTTALSAKIQDLAKILEATARHKPVLIIYAAEGDVASKSSSLRMAKRAARTAGDEAQVYYCDPFASQLLARCMKTDQVIDPGAAKLFQTSKGSDPVSIEHDALSRVLKTAAVFAETLRQGVDSFLAEIKDFDRQSGSIPAEEDKQAPIEKTLVANFEKALRPCEIFVTPEIKKILQIPGQSKGLPHPVQNALVAKLNSPEGKFEPKGRHFWGIDITSGPNAYRAVFTLAEDQKMVLIMLGGHDDYQAFTNLVKYDPDRYRRQYTDDKSIEKFDIPYVKIDQDRIFKAMTGHFPAPNPPLRPPSM